MKEVIDPVIRRNAYYAIPENFLLAIVTDERDEIRNCGIKKILELKKKKPKVKKTVIPKLNFDAENYSELIAWQDRKDLIVPPILSHLEEEDLQELIDLNEKIVIPKYPCHTQQVERHVKLVTEAAASVYGASARDGLIRSKIQSRKIE